MSYGYNRNKTKNILIIVVAALVLLATVGGVFAFVGKDSGTTLNFTIGGLTDNGTYEESDGTLYTKEAVEIDEAFRVKLDFDSTIKYQIFFYDENDTFLKATEVLANTSTPEIPENATSFRVEITPIWDAGLKADERVIGRLEVNQYAKQLKIVVIEAEADTEAEA